MPKLKTGGRLPIGTKSQYDNVVSIYQSLVSKGVDPQAALDLVNQKVAEKGWTGYATGDNKKFNNVDQFTDHLIDWHSRMYPDSLKAKNFNDYWKGIMITPKNKYNPRGNAYKKELLLTRPGVKKRINFYRKQQGLNPLALITQNQDNIIYAQKGNKLQKDSQTVNWITSWLNNRKSQLRNNYLVARDKGWSRLSYNRPHPINAIIDMYKGNPEGYTTTQEILKNQLDNLNRSRAIVEDDSKKVYPGNDIFAQLEQWKWDSDRVRGTTRLNNLIIYNPRGKETKVQEIDPSTRVHEMTHTLGDVKGTRILPYREETPQETVIREKYMQYFDKSPYREVDADYLIQPTEIYSRLMQLRYDTGLKPNQKVNKQWLHKNKDLINKYDLLFKDDKLIDMLNEIASNGNYNQNLV